MKTKTKTKIKTKTKMKMKSIRAPKVPFNFHCKIGMKKDIFVYFNFKTEK